MSGCFLFRSVIVNPTRVIQLKGLTNLSVTSSHTILTLDVSPTFSLKPSDVRVMDK